METGISLYLGSGFSKNSEIIVKAKQANVQYVFTSLHIPEETGVDYASEVSKLLDACKQANLHLFVDISPHTLEKLNVSSYDELHALNITHVRVDYGFTYEEIVALSKSFYVVLNTSTILEDDIRELVKLNADFSKFYACHNFYPKPYTGISLDSVTKMNTRLRYLGIKTMTFVAGDQEFRGPLCKGLPTLEAHRNGDVILNMLELYAETASDVCLIGDIDVSDAVWKQLKNLHDNYVDIHVELEPEYDFLHETVHYDRPDSSDYFIRSQQSRFMDALKNATQGNVRVRKMGDICVTGKQYGRYNGELEIMKLDLPKDDGVRIVGRVIEEDRKYLSVIKNGIGIKFKRA